MRRNSDDVFEPLRGAPKEPWPRTTSPAEVIRVLEPIVLDARRERILTVLASRLESVTVLMDAPHDPHNGGAVLRSCDAFGVQTLHVVPREQPFVMSNRVTRGTERWVDVVLHATPEEATTSLSERGFTLVSTHPEGTLVPPDLVGIERLALVLGNEHDGVCEALSRAAHETVRVPMRGFVESLNVSVTAGILLSWATNGRPGDLSEDERERLYARALYGNVPRAAEVLEGARARGRP